MQFNEFMHKLNERSLDNVPMEVYGKIKDHWKKNGYGYKRKELISKIAYDFQSQADASKKTAVELANRVMDELKVKGDDTYYSR